MPHSENYENLEAQNLFQRCLRDFLKVWCSHVRLFPGPSECPDSQTTRSLLKVANLMKKPCHKGLQIWGYYYILVHIFLKEPNSNKFVDKIGRGMVDACIFQLYHISSIPTPTPESHPKVGAQAKNWNRASDVRGPSGRKCRQMFFLVVSW